MLRTDRDTSPQASAETCGPDPRVPPPQPGKEPDILALCRLLHPGAWCHTAAGAAHVHMQVSFKSEMASTLRDKLAAQERGRTSAEEVRVLRGEAASLTGQLDAFVKAKVGLAGRVWGSPAAGEVLLMSHANEALAARLVASEEKAAVAHSRLAASEGAGIAQRGKLESQGGYVLSLRATISELNGWLGQKGLQVTELERALSLTTAKLSGLEGGHAAGGAEEADPRVGGEGGRRAARERELERRCAEMGRAAVMLRADFVVKRVEMAETRLRPPNVSTAPSFWPAQAIPSRSPSALRASIAFAFGAQPSSSMQPTAPPADAARRTARTHRTLQADRAARDRPAPAGARSGAHARRAARNAAWRADRRSRARSRRARDARRAARSQRASRASRDHARAAPRCAIASVRARARSPRSAAPRIARARRVRRAPIDDAARRRAIAAARTRRARARMRCAVIAIGARARCRIDQARPAIARARATPRARTQRRSERARSAARCMGDAQTRAPRDRWRRCQRAEAIASERTRSARSRAPAIGAAERAAAVRATARRHPIGESARSHRAARDGDPAAAATRARIAAARARRGGRVQRASAMPRAPRGDRSIAGAARREPRG
ncbi:MAG: hypothetical protein WDW38_010596 [Sanguina aurantia]